MCRTLRRFAVPLALVLLFLQVPARSAYAASAGGAFRFTEWLEMLTRLWAPAGCIVDPSDSAPPSDAECGADPGGRCATTPIWAPEGCGLDPGGRCLNSVPPQRDAGCGLDPGGNCEQ